MLLLVKVRNAGELLWDSLDTQERLVLCYVVVSLLVSLCAAIGKATRERVSDEVVLRLRLEPEPVTRDRAGD